jgi:hypothetical protein
VRVSPPKPPRRSTSRRLPPPPPPPPLLLTWRCEARVSALTAYRCGEAGTLVVAGCEDEPCLRVWQAATGALARQASPSHVFGSRVEFVGATKKGLPNRISHPWVLPVVQVDSHRVSRDSLLVYEVPGGGLRLASGGSDDGTVRIRDAGTFKPLIFLEVCWEGGASPRNRGPRRLERPQLVSEIETCGVWS